MVMTDGDDLVTPTLNRTWTTDSDGKQFGHSTLNGLTKRELFAAMAMQGFLASKATTALNFEAAARLAVYQADALIDALNGPINTDAK